MLHETRNNITERKFLEMKSNLTVSSNVIQQKMKIRKSKGSLVENKDEKFKF